MEEKNILSEESLLDEKSSKFKITYTLNGDKFITLDSGVYKRITDGNGEEGFVLWEAPKEESNYPTIIKPMGDRGVNYYGKKNKGSGKWD